MKGPKGHEELESPEPDVINITNRLFAFYPQFEMRNKSSTAQVL